MRSKGGLVQLPVLIDAPPLGSLASPTRQRASTLPLRCPGTHPAAATRLPAAPLFTPPMGAAPCQVGPYKPALNASSPRCPQDLGVTPTYSGSEGQLPGLTPRPAHATSGLA